MIFRYAWRNAPRMSSRTVPRRPLQALPALARRARRTAEARLALLRSASRATRSSPAGSTSRTPPPPPGSPGTPRRPPAEYTIRVLHTWDIAPAALGGLAELYREARYSRHPVTEQHRAEAIARLMTIRRGPQRVADEAAAKRRRWPRRRPRPGG